MKSLFAAGLACALLAGCAAEPGYAWRRIDGQSAQSDPALHRQFETDKTTCIDTMQSAGLSGATSEGGDLAGTIQAMHRQDALEAIRECMARKGYTTVPIAEVRQRDDALTASAMH